MTPIRDHSVLFSSPASASYGHALPLLEKLTHHGFAAFLVGGGIRDLLLGREPGDWDVACSAKPEQLLEIWPEAKPTGLKHGTVTVLSQDHPVEVTSFRSDGPYSDGRHPDWVHFGVSLEEDLSRRDFTVNAMALDPLEQTFEDPHGGQDDLRSGLLRTVGDPDRRFAEDGLRPLRGIRLASVLEFSIETATLSAIRRSRTRVAGVALERVRGELVKMMAARRPSIGLELLRTTGTLEVVLPELMEGVGMSQNRHHAYDVYSHILHTVDAAPESNLRVRLAALFHDIGKPRTRKVVEGEATFIGHDSVGAAMTSEIMSRLRFSNRETEAVSHLVAEHLFHYTPDWTDAAVRRFVKRVGSEHLEDLFELRGADNVGSGLKEKTPESLAELQTRVGQVLQAEDATSVSDLDITGDEVMSILNLQPGPVVGAVLDQLLELVMENPAMNNNKDLAAALKQLPNPNKSETKA